MKEQKELVWLQYENKFYILHADFLGRLSFDLDLGQIEQVKDGFTNGLLTQTYDSYLSEYPAMTDIQMVFTYSNLYAAREMAVDKIKVDDQDALFEYYKKKIDTFLILDSVPPEVDDDPAYTAVLVSRVDGYLPNIISTSDPRYEHIRELVVWEYKYLARAHDQRDADIEATRNDPDLDLATKNLYINLINYRTELAVYYLHDEFVGRLNAELSLEEVDGIKSWISYNVYNLTYNAYLELNPDMTEVQKQFAHGYLFAARELAMDKGSSDEKHAIFNKYKGIINNYLAGLYNPNSHLEYDWTQFDTTGVHADGWLLDEMKIKLYPNPADNIIFLEFFNERSVRNISLFSNIGQKILNISDGELSPGL